MDIQLNTLLVALMFVTILSMGMEYHVVHHLFPKIPLFQTGPAYWEMRELLLSRGIRNDGL